MKKTTAVEALAQLKLESIQKRKAFWKEFSETAVIVVACIIGLAALVMLMISLGGGMDYFRDADKLKARISALESVNNQDPTGFRVSMLGAEIARLSRRIDELQPKPQTLPLFNLFPGTITNCVTTNISISPSMVITNF